ncbi:hypothetical protein M5K25_028026 [Dendrobium thyrsiflorum]|uniref:Uncharacterized protein n=1 Tax=Dendrobium thyrsiflorum TaxID=117978 RepID=A0ABD0TVE1_DENTH
MAEPSSFRHIIKQLIGIADPFSTPYVMDSADAEEASSAESLSTSFCLIASALAIFDVVNRDELVRKMKNQDHEGKEACKPFRS